MTWPDSGCALCLAIFIAVAAPCVRGAGPASSYVLGAPGANCFDTCLAHGLNTLEYIASDNSTGIFTAAGANCSSFDAQPWANSAQPFLDTATGVCSGYVGVPHGVAAQGYWPGARRVCHCAAPAKAAGSGPFGTSYSQGIVDSVENTMFSFVLHHGAAPRAGVMTHFWITPAQPSTMVRYYIDGETTASIAFRPYLACGTGFNGDHAPWGTKWFGKGAKKGGWFWNFRVPFQTSVRVTVTADTPDVVYVILRGGHGIPISVGGITVPTATARLVQHTVNATYPALAFVRIADVPSGKQGVFFMHTLSFTAPNLNTLEGCYHWYSPRNASWPGMLLSSGTEDFFDSAYYFDAGKFWLPVSGMTVKQHGRASQSPANTTTDVKLSAYRFHDEDPLAFSDGLIIDWRNGDMTDAAGVKCLSRTGGITNGAPGPAAVEAYSWTYVFNP